MSVSHPDDQIITPDQAAAILEPQVQTLQAEGWVVVAQHDFMARLTRGRRNMDLEVDLLGQLSMEEKPLSPEQEMGQIVAWLLVGAVLFLMFTIASILGLFN